MSLSEVQSPSPSHGAPPGGLPPHSPKAKNQDNVTKAAAGAIKGASAGAIPPPPSSPPPAAPIKEGTQSKGKDKPTMAKKLNPTAAVISTTGANIEGILKGRSSNPELQATVQQSREKADEKAKKKSVDFSNKTEVKIISPYSSGSSSSDGQTEAAAPLLGDGDIQGLLGVLDEPKKAKMAKRCRCDSLMFVVALAILGASVLGRTQPGLNTLFFGSRPFAIGALCVGIIATLCVGNRLRVSCKLYCLCC